MITENTTPRSVHEQMLRITCNATAEQRRTKTKKLFTELLRFKQIRVVSKHLKSVPDAVNLIKIASGVSIAANIGKFSQIMMAKIIDHLTSQTNEDAYNQAFCMCLGYIHDGLVNPTHCKKAKRSPNAPIYGYHTQLDKLSDYRPVGTVVRADDYQILVKPFANITVTDAEVTPPSPSPTPTESETPMKNDTFDVNLTSDLVLCLANHRARLNDSVGYEFDPKETMRECIDQAKEDVAEGLGLSASQRVAVQASVSLIMETENWKEDSGLLSTLQELGIDTDADDRLSSDDEDVTEPVVASVVEPVAVDPDLKSAINTMVKASGVTQPFEIEKDINELNNLRVKAKEWEAEIKHLKGRTFTVPVQVTGETEIDGDTLTYEVVQRNAMELFKNPKTGKKIKQLDFNIPTLIWKDSKGDEVRHPMCPNPVEHYQFRATHLIKFLTAFIMGKNVWCHGHTGTGKTTLPEQIASIVGFPLFPINLDGNLERADLTGQTDIVNDGGTSVTKFREGVLPRAMVQPCILVLDEIDAGKPDVMFVVQRATEGKGLLLTEDGGRLVKPHPLFRFVATANSRGQGDEYGVYAGVRPMNGALLNRFPIFIEVDYMTKDEETTFLKRTYNLDDDVIDNITTFAGLCRKAFAQGETTVPVSPRDTMAISELYAFYETILTTKTQAMEFAVTTSVIDRSPLDNRQRVIELADRAFASCKFTS